MIEFQLFHRHKIQIHKHIQKLQAFSDVYHPIHKLLYCASNSLSQCGSY